MPLQGPPWTEFLSCHVCFNMFDEQLHRPISLGCGHTVCKNCLNKLQNNKCPFDQAPITCNLDDLPVNYALLQLVGAAIPDRMCDQKEEALITSEKLQYYDSSKKCIEDLAVYLKSETGEKADILLDDDDNKSSVAGNLPSNGVLSRPMQRKLVSLVNCQLMEEEGRSRAMRAARSLGERTVTELILQHQNPHQLSANLWAAVRARGCQFLGPAMQEEVLKLILLVLEDGSALSRKVLVSFVVQHLEKSYPQASKTAIGHVVQLLYRASCFRVTKREEESSLMQLKEEFRTYDALRREHDSQIVQIAMEAGLRISPEQWSSLLYGDASHKSHMQSIIDKLQTPQSFSQSINEFTIALQRTGDPCNLQRLRPHLDFLANIDPSPDAPSPTWENLEAILKALRTVVQGLVDFFTNYTQKKELLPLQNARYKTSMCRDQTNQGMCPRGTSCTFAHSQEELEKYRARSKKLGIKGTGALPNVASLSHKEKAELDRVNKATSEKLALYSKSSVATNKSPGPPTNESEYPVTADASLNQSLSAMSLTSPKAGSPPDPSPANANSGIPRANTTPSIATPAYYRKPTLGMEPAVRETYYHPRMSQGATRMTPYEMSAVGGCTFGTHSYHMGTRGHQRAAGRYPPPHLIQDAGLHRPLHPNPYRAMDQPPLMKDHSQDQWAMPPLHYCSQQEYYYPYGPQHCCNQQETLCSPAMPPPNYQPPDHRFYQRQPPTQYQTVESGPGYCSQSTQSLNDLHMRRNTILAHFNQTVSCRPGARQTNNQESCESKSHVMSSKPAHEDITQPSMPRLSKSICYTDVTQTAMFSSANSGIMNDIPSNTTSISYVPWSCDDSDVMERTDNKSGFTQPWSTETGNGKLVDPEEDVDTDDDAKSIFRWLEEESNSARSFDDKSDVSHSHQNRMSSPYEDDLNFVPFEPQLISKYGPISRMARSKFNNTEPVRVTAEESVKTLTPVTAVTQMDCPVPVPAPVPSRFSVKERPLGIGHVADSRLVSTMNMFTMNLPSQDHALMSNDPTRLSRPQMQREVARLETKAQDALTKDESLAFELQAIELKISLKHTDDNREPVKKGYKNMWSMGSHQSSHAPPSVRPSDPILTAEETNKLRQLTAVEGDKNQKRSEQQERILAQLLKIQDLGSQSGRYRHDH